MHHRRIALAAGLLLVVTAPGVRRAAAQDPASPPPSAPPAQPAAPAKPLFVNAAKERGLGGIAGKTVVLADLNGDGWLDVVLDRRRVFLSEKGTKFTETTEHGIPFPKVKVAPRTKEGKPDVANTKEQEFVPAWLNFADVDGDGDLDALWGVHSDWEVLAETNGKPGWQYVPEFDPGVRTSVFLNDGKGRFTRGPESQFTAKGESGPSMAVACVDADRDGRLDLFEGREYRQYGVLWGCGGDRLWAGDGKGGFADVTPKAGMSVVPEPALPNSARPSYGVTTADFNGDGRTDLLQLAYGRQWNRQWQANADGTYTDVGIRTFFAGDDITHGRYPEQVNRAAEQPFRSNGNTFDCAVADYDRDGDLDCYLGEIAHAWAGESSDPPALLVNEGAAKDFVFRRIPVDKALPKRPFRDARNFQYADLHVAWLDYDLDGFEDLLIASGDYPDGQFLRLYRQREDHSFEEVTEAAGFAWEGAGGLSVGDVDRDGDVDILVGRSFMRLSQAHRDQFMGGITVPEPGLFLNQTITAGTAPTGATAAPASAPHWLNVRLEGKGTGGSNRQGVGAWVQVVAGGVTQTRELRQGSGLGNHQDPVEAVFGLGKTAKIDVLRVRWPDAKGTVTEYRDVPVDRFVTVSENEGAPRTEPAAR